MIWLYFYFSRDIVYSMKLVRISLATLVLAVSLLLCGCVPFVPIIENEEHRKPIPQEQPDPWSPVLVEDEPLPA